MCWRPLLQKFRVLLFDEILICGILFVPLKAGLHHFGVRSTYIFGTANWAQFCPGNENGNPR